MNLEWHSENNRYECLLKQQGILRIMWTIFLLIIYFFFLNLKFDFLLYAKFIYTVKI